MNPDAPSEFERRLQRQPPQTLPPAWRAEILAAAVQAAAARPQPRDSSQRPILVDFLAQIFWPHPRAWAGLAALWLLIAALDFSAREPARPDLARRAPPAAPSPQLRQMLQQQEQMFAELLGPAEKPRSAPHTSQADRPRSQRRPDFFNA